MQRFWRSPFRRAAPAPAAETPVVEGRAPEDSDRATVLPTGAAPAPFAADPARWAPGSTVAGLYRVDTLLGAGGMGEVHRVRHLGWQHDIAVKSPRPELWAGERGTEAFLEEARVWVGLEPNPYVCACHYVRVVAGVPRIFSEFAEGGSVADALRGGRITTVEQILDIGIQTAWGLHAAHRAGVVHQDVKPANMLLGGDGRAMLTDFGLARVRAGAAPAGAVPPAVPDGGGDGSILVTRTGLTPAYASPEQMAGSRVGRRSDMWSWAASVLELFLGEVVWMAGPVAGEALRAAVREPAAPGRPPIPHEVAELLDACLSVDPDSRPPDMDAVAARLVRVHEARTGRPFPRAAAPTVSHLADGWNNRALSLHDLGEAEAADRCWRKALEADPRHPGATFNRGLARWRAGEITDAALVRDLESARAAHPGDSRPLHLLGLAHLERGDARAALEALREAERSGPAGPDPETGAALRAAAVAAGRSVPGRTLPGHTAWPHSLSVTPDGRYALSGGSQNEVFRWDLGTGARIGTVDSVADHVMCVALTPDAGSALVCDGPVGNEPSWWDLAKEKRRGVLRGHPKQVTALVITPDGRHALTGSRDRTLRWWSLPGGRCRRVLSGHTDEIWSVAVTPDGRRALSGGSDGTVRCWDLASGSCARPMTGHEWVHSVGMSPDGLLGLSGGAEGTARVWDLAAGRCVRVLEGHSDAVRSVAVGPDGRHALTGSADGTACWWDLVDGRCLRTFAFPGHGIEAVAFAGPHDAVVSYAGGIERFRLEPGEPAPWSYSLPGGAEELGARAASFREHLERSRRLAGADDPAGAAAALRSAGAVPGFARHPEVVGLWRRIGPYGTRTGLRDVRHAGIIGGEENGHLGDLALTEDGRRALSGGWDNRIRLWDLTTAECLHEFTGAGPEGPQYTGLPFGRPNLYRVRAVAMTPDGRFGAAASEEGSVQTWDLTTGAAGPVMPGGDGSAEAVAVTSDARRLLVGYQDGTVRLWDAAVGRCVRTLTGHTSTTDAVALTPDGRFGLSGSWDRTARLWDLGTGRCLRVMTGSDEPVTEVALTPDGGRALLGGWAADARWFDARTGACLRVLTGHTDGIASVAVTPDGRHGFTASTDGTMRWWDLGDGSCLRAAPLTGHIGTVEAVAVTPDAQSALSAGPEGTLRLWEFDWDFDFPS
ncbi:protein kinase [Streptomyces sp. NPDC001777]|uniref:protein kinase domain-containing protein n=1 Tax=Streptomyces sp. NPDC001777 TaxID=3364608 RepID=UPI0036D139B2